MAVPATTAGLAVAGTPVPDQLSPMTSTGRGAPSFGAATSALSAPPPLGADAVATALDELARSTRAASSLDALAAVSGPRWAGQLGNEADGPAADGRLLGSPVVLAAHPRGRPSWLH